jgi:hypothetical protein
MRQVAPGAMPPLADGARHRTALAVSLNRASAYDFAGRLTDAARPLGHGGQANKNSRLQTH